jgi:mycothiol S-conjugate amidase
LRGSAANVMSMTERRCLLSVHAHPDDESSKGPGTIARYHADGVHTVLVTCTGGEEGEILNPALDREDVRLNLAQVRMSELEHAVQIIGYDELIMLGYRDSGMVGTEANENSSSFHQAPIDEAVERLVKILRETRPQVIVTYPEDQGGYQHPDHIRVHEISVLAFDAAGDPQRYPNAGEPYTPSKLYYSVWSKEQLLERHAKFDEHGLDSPYSEGPFLEWFERDEPPATTRIELNGFAHVRNDALLAHETQIDPSSKFWFGLPPEVEQSIFSYEMYILAKSNVGPLGLIEDDLFAGVED